MKRQTGILILAVMIAVGVLLLADQPRLVATMNEQAAYEGSICINEVCSWNEYAIHGRDHSYDDYIELYNGSEETISLDGWFLSDDKDDLRKCSLKELTLAPGDFVLVYANGQPDEESEETTVSFGIRQTGEQIFLSDVNGKLMDAVDVPSLEANTVYARREDGASSWGKYTPTPGYANGDASKVRDIILEEPTFSSASGFYEQEFSLTLSAEKKQTIYYTLDGSIPTTESEVYSCPIQVYDRSGEPDVYNAVSNVVSDWKNYTPDQKDVDKAFVVRAIAVDEKGNYSDVKTAVYFVNLNQYKDVDVLCLTADPEDLFGEEGIYVTGAEYDDWYLSGAEGEAPRPEYMHSGRGAEIPGNVQLMEAGDLKMDQAVGLRIQGEGSRGQSKKRFAIYSRKEYSGSAYFDYELYEGRKTHSVFLNPGLSNVLSTNLLSDRDLALPQTRKVVVFLDGEYWYTTHMLEKSNRHMLAEAFGVEPDNVVLVKEGIVTEGSGADLDFYDRLFELVTQADMSQPENYELVTQRMDVQSYIDFMCANLYLCNMDVSENHNYMAWRTRVPEDSPYGDERWRWVLYDMDFLEYIDVEYYQKEEKAQILSFDVTMPNSDGTYLTQSLFEGLLANAEFKKQFVLSFMDMANVNFSLENVEQELQKWGEDLSWEGDFFAHRFEYIVRDLKESLELEGELAELILEAEHGTIMVNSTMPDLSSGNWSGQYFTDYPVTLTAIPEDGYTFIGWEGDYESAEPTLELDLTKESTWIKALFEKNDE